MRGIDRSILWDVFDRNSAKPVPLEAYWGLAREAGASPTRHMSLEQGEMAHIMGLEKHAYNADRRHWGEPGNANLLCPVKKKRGQKGPPAHKAWESMDAQGTGRLLQGRIPEDRPAAREGGPNSGIRRPTISASESMPGSSSNSHWVSHGRRRNRRRFESWAPAPTLPISPRPSGGRGRHGHRAGGRAVPGLQRRPVVLRTLEGAPQDVCEARTREAGRPGCIMQTLSRPFPSTRQVGPMTGRSLPFTRDLPTFRLQGRDR